MVWCWAMVIIVLVNEDGFRTGLGLVAFWKPLNYLFQRLFWGFGGLRV